MTRLVRACVVVALGVSLASCDEEVSVGTQCPSPFSGMASVEHPPDASGPAFYGTSCAPCSPDDEVRLDEDGCPIYVTFAECRGGDLCLFGLRVVAPAADAGTAPDADTRDASDDDAGGDPLGDDDASVADDAGAEEDGG